MTRSRGYLQFSRMERAAADLAVAADQPYLPGMEVLRRLSPLSLVLRGLLLVALLSIAPLYKLTYAGADGGMAAISAQNMPAPHMPAQGMAGQDKSGHEIAAGHSPASHGGLDVGCRILCFGWVEAPVSARQDGQISVINLTLLPAVAARLNGIAPAPNRHPPKPLPVV